MDSFSQEDEIALFVPLPRAKQRVIDTIKELGLRVLPADVVSRTGLPVHEATRLLNKVAAETAATLEVASTGDIYYQFSPRFESKYAVRGMEKTLLSFFTTLFRIGFFALRVSFGIILLVSLVVVITLILVVIIGALFSDNGGGGGDVGVGDFGGGGGGGGGGSSSSSGGFFDLGSIGDGFAWNYTESHQRKIEHYGVADKSWRPKQQIKKGNFFLECFSFLFGDGDPNPNLEEIRWQMVAEVIRKNNFVVTAEQVAPYTSKNPKNESEMFQTLARFDGVPTVTVTESGNIAYLFDSMRRQTSPTMQMSKVHQTETTAINVPRYLEENWWTFSEYPAPALITVFIFAVVNFAGSWWLFKHIATIHLLQDFVVLIDVLLGYGALFLLIPILRLVFIAVMNQTIAAKNSEREEYSQAVATEDVRLKIQDAQAHAKSLLPSAEATRIIYQTNKDLLEQQFEQNQNP